MHAPRRVLLLLATILCAACAAPAASAPAVFDVRAFGASGRRGDDARPALHAANFPSEALFHGIDLEQVALLGRGTIDGCASYEWREHDHDDRYIWPNQVAMRAAGKSLQRSYPSADSAGNLVRLVRCTDIAIRGLSLKRSPSWNIHLWGCERIVIDGVSIRSSLTEGVWSDGIDPDGCKDLRISNCTIETGDDALVFYSTDLFGPARPCEDVTVTNCRLTSSSSALKFGDGNKNAIRRVTVSNCTIANSNRGIAFMVYDGGTVEDIVLSDLVIECTRRDWFWWGDGEPFYFDVRPRSELDERLRSPAEPPAGRVRNVLIQNVIARGTGSSILSGHATSPLENITFDGLCLTLAHDPAAPYERAEHAFAVRHARDLTLRGVELRWSEPASATWRSALACEDVAGLRLEGLAAHPAPTAPSTVALAFTNVSDALLSGCRAVVGTSEFLRVAGPRSRDIQLLGNDLRAARSAWSLAPDALDAVRASGDLAPRP